MPELPEVQCVINTLQRMVGKTFSTCSILNERLREPVQPDLEAHLTGKTITAISRLGKYILISLSEGHLVCHLGMTGKLVIDAHKGKHDRLQFGFDDGSWLTYNDVRKFGFVTYVSCPGESKYLRKLGLEPLSDGFTPQRLITMCSGVKTPIKVFLLDQSKVAGLGNIYVNEVLYECGIDPYMASRSLTAIQSAKLVPAIKDMLERSILAGGSSISDYRDADDKKGSFQDTFKVYGKVTDPLGNLVTRSVLGGRSTFHVAELQPSTA